VRHAAPPPFVAPLRAQDRCDRCDARALYRATRGIAVLLLCGHHGAEHAAALTAEGWLVEQPILGA
jgi:hypothetical protein